MRKPKCQHGLVWEVSPWSIALIESPGVSQRRSSSTEHTQMRPLGKTRGLSALGVEKELHVW